MGEFSWHTNNTNNQIGSEKMNTINVVMVWFDGNGKLRFNIEKNYEGYGEFGGVDFYDALAQMNGYNWMDGRTYNLRSLVDRSTKNLEHDWLQKGKNTDEFIEEYVTNLKDELNKINSQELRSIGIDLSFGNLPPKYQWDEVVLFDHYKTNSLPKTLSTSDMSFFTWGNGLENLTMQEGCEKHIVKGIHSWWSDKKHFENTKPVLYPQLFEFRDNGDGTITIPSVNRLDFTDKPEDDENQGWYVSETCFEDW